MIRNAVKKTLNGLRTCNSGNATLIVALGMPALIGSAGLGVDMAQWYMWKRELQFAADQGAIAGAWAMTDNDTEADYDELAVLELNANLAATKDFADEPTVQLANYAGGVLNSVTVTVSATKELPFTSFLTGESATVSAFAQASFAAGATFTSCLIATDVDDEGAITIGGNAVLTASCGLAALSTDDLSIDVTGNPDIEAGWIISAGGVDEWLKDNTDDVILEYQDGLYDPFADLDPPEPEESQVARTYSCTDQADITVADVTTRTIVDYSYWKGRNTSSATAWDFAGALADSDNEETLYDQIVPPGTVAGYFPGTPGTQWTLLGGNGNNKEYQKKVTTVHVTYADVDITEGQQAGDVVPGTYENIHVGCATNFAPGVYIIDGGGLKITGQYEVTGAGVMFVLKNGAWIDIAGGADVSLTAMLVSELMNVGLSAQEANDLSGMLVFEDRESEGSDKTKINGNSVTTLNGTFYFPVSQVDFAGTAKVSSQCLMIAANRIKITGTTNMTTFCPEGVSEDDVVASIGSTVRLVA